MKEIRKVLSLVLVLVIMTASLLVGCGEKESDEKNVLEKGEQTEASNEVDEPSNDEDEQDEVLEPVTLKLLLTGPGKQQDSEKVWAEVNQLLQEYLPNTTLDIEVVAPGEYKEKWQLMIAAGEEVDIAWTGWVIPYLEEVGRGAYLPLDELIDEYAPTIKEELPAWVIEKAKVGGKIYSIPNYQMMTSVRAAIKTPKALADEYLDMDATLTAFNASKKLTAEKYEAIEKYLEILKENDKLQQGISPHSMLTTSGNVFNGYEQIVSGVFIDPYSDDPYKVLSSVDIPEIKLESDYYNSWYQKGYIRQDVIGNNISDLRMDEGKPDGYVMWEHQYLYDQDNVDSVRYGFEITNVPVIDTYYLNNSQSATSMTIPRTSENPERAMMFLELLNTEKGSEIYNMLVWGLEGEHYNIVSEGRIETLDYQGQGSSDSRYGLWKWAMGNTFNAWQTQADSEGTLDYIENEMHAKAMVSPIMGFKLDSSPVKTQLAQLNAVIKEYSDIKWHENYDELYTMKVEKMKAAGLDEVVAEVQKQLDAWVEENK